MAVKTAVVIVGTVATKLSMTATDRLPGSSIAVKAGTVTLYVGGSDVTAANGWPIDAGTKEAFDLQIGENLYGIVASGTSNVSVIRTGV